MQDLLKSPMVSGAVGMLFAAGGFVLSYSGAGQVFGYAGALLGAGLGAYGIYCAIHSRRSMRLPINAVVMSGLFLVGNIAFGQFGSLDLSTSAERPEVRARRVEGQLSYLESEIRSTQRKISQLEEMYSQMARRPELVDKVVIGNCSARYEEGPFRLANRELTTCFELMLDVEIDNQTEFDFERIRFDIRCSPADEIQLDMFVHDTRLHIPNGTTAVVPVRIQRHVVRNGEPVRASLPDLESLTWDVQFQGASTISERGDYRSLISAGPNRDQQEEIASLRSELEEQQLDHKELEAELRQIGESLPSIP